MGPCTCRALGRALAPVTLVRGVPTTSPTAEVFLPLAAPEVHVTRALSPRPSPEDLWLREMGSGE